MFKLNMQLSKIIQDELIGIYQKLKETIVYVAYDIEEVMRLGTIIVIRENDEVVMVGQEKK